MSSKRGRWGTFEERFWRRVVKSDGCWLWTGHKDRLGYGKCRSRDDRSVLAHRQSWELEHGQVPYGLCVLHRCDNTSCVHPDHLWLGTVADNNADMVAKRRSRFGERNHNAKLSEQAAKSLLLAQGACSVSEAAGRFGVAPRTVRRIWQREGWLHLHSEPPQEQP